MHDDGRGDFGVGSWIERRARIRPDRPALIYGDANAHLRRVRGSDPAPGERPARARRRAGGPRRVARPEPSGLPRDILRGRPAWRGAGAGQPPVVGRRAGCHPRPDGARSPSSSTPAWRRQPRRSGTGWPSRTATASRARWLRGAHRRLAGPTGRRVARRRRPAAPAAHVGHDGSPKAVMLTHGNVTWNVVNSLSVSDFRPDDVTAAIAPFFRVGGTGVNVLPVLFLGGTVVVPDDPSPDGLLGLMERHRVTVGFANPDLLDAIARAERVAVGRPVERPVHPDRRGARPGTTDPRLPRPRPDARAGLRAVRGGAAGAPAGRGQRPRQDRFGRPAAAVRRRPDRRSETASRCRPARPGSCTSAART